MLLSPRTLGLRVWQEDCIHIVTQCHGRKGGVHGGPLDGVLASASTGGPEKVLCSPRVLQRTHTWVKVQVANDCALSPGLSHDSTRNSCKWRRFQPQKA